MSRKTTNVTANPESANLPEVQGLLAKTPVPAKTEPKKPGRPRRAAKYEDIIAATEDDLFLLLHFIREPLKELILGVKVLEYDTGREKEIVYRKEPNIQAIKLLLERTLGKVEQKVEHTGSIEHTGTLELDIPDDEMLSILEVAAQDIKRKMGEQHEVIDVAAEDVREITTEEEE